MFFINFVSVLVPPKTERIQQWLSSCETKQPEIPNHSYPKPSSTSPKTHVKMRCIAKSPPRYPEKRLSPIFTHEPEPTRFRTCLKIHLKTNEPTNARSRASSSTSKHYPLAQTNFDEDNHDTDEDYYQRQTLSPSFSRDHQAVFL